MAGDGVANSHIATIVDHRRHQPTDGVELARAVQAIVHATLHEKPPGGHTVELSFDGQGGRREPCNRPAHLGRARPTAPPRQDVEVVDRPGVRREADRCRGGLRADVDAEPAEVVGELGGRAACPLQTADGVPGRFGGHQGFDAGDDFGRFLSSRGRPPPARRTRSTSTSRSTSCRRPVATVDGSMPRRETMRRSPPHPHLSDSSPANSRRWRSSSRLANNTMAARNFSGIRSASGRGRPSPGVAISSRRARS